MSVLTVLAKHPHINSLRIAQDWLNELAGMGYTLTLNKAPRNERLPSAPEAWRGEVNVEHNVPEIKPLP